MDNKLYDYLQSLLPDDLQFVDPYIDDSPVPNTDWCSMNILNTDTIGRSAERQGDIDKQNKTLTVYYDLNKVYKIQFDFYGANAFNNASIYLQTLQVELDENKSSNYYLKTIGTINNLTELLEDTRYLKRYSFYIDLFTIETINKTSYYIDNFKYNIVVYDN